MSRMETGSFSRRCAMTGSYSMSLGLCVAMITRSRIINWTACLNISKLGLRLDFESFHLILLLNVQKNPFPRRSGCLFIAQNAIP